MSCIVLAVVASFVMVSQPAFAHQTAVSTLNVEVRPDKREVDMLLAISPDDVTDHLKLDPNGDGWVDQSELPYLEPAIGSYFEEHLQVTNNGQVCQPTHQDFVDMGRRMASLLFRKTVQCDDALGEVTLTNEVMLASKNGYTHYGQIQIGKDIHTTVFNRDTSSYTVQVGADGQAASEQSFWDVFVQYIWQGVLHIVLGIDHVLFVLCLLLAARRFRPLLVVVTSFTLAHSITLALSALEVLTLPPTVVEPLIALSIAWVAVELLLEAKKPADASKDDEEVGPPLHLYALTFAFGLLHGFGFSYVLRDEVGLPTDALVPALLSFNVGVELGQIAIVAAAFPLVAWARGREWGSKAIKVVAALVLLVSVYWFVTRLM
ncbi:HupE/UreJ family protein [Persicimonas caeni]|nr:HupE/UreJ family protein [Persicimonas caeni]